MTFPTLSVSGLTCTELATTQVALISGGADTQLHRFVDGRFALPKTTSVGLYSTDAESWSEGATGPAQGGYKCAAELGNSETLNIHRTTTGLAGAVYTYQRSLDDWVTVGSPANGVVSTPLAVPLNGDNGSSEAGMLFHHGVLVKRSNGDLIATMYGNYAGDTRLADGYPPVWNFRKFRTIVVTSQDKGLTWGNPVPVGYDMMRERGTNADSQVITYADSPIIAQEGLCEADLVYAPNGDMLCFMRSGARNFFNDSIVMSTPVYMSRSLDDGATWDTPIPIAGWGANPNAVTLASGVIILIYSNPGTWVCFSDDNGHTWKGHTQISTSSAYGDIAEYDEDTALLVYADNGYTQATKLRVVKTGFDIPPRVELLANPNRIAAGQQSVLTWFTANASGGLLNGGPWTNQSIGASSVATSTGVLNQTTTFRARFNSVSHPGNYVERSVTVTVT